jgi:hypothetical protein
MRIGMGLISADCPYPGSCPFQNYTMVLPYGGYCPPAGVPAPAGMVPSGIPNSCATTPDLQGRVYGPTQNPQAYGGALGPSGGVTPTEAANTPSAGSGVTQADVHGSAQTPTGSSLAFQLPAFLSGTLIDNIPNWMLLLGAAAALYFMVKK